MVRASAVANLLLQEFPGQDFSAGEVGSPFSKWAWLRCSDLLPRSSWPSTATSSLVSLKTKSPHPERLSNYHVVLLGVPGRDFRSSLWGRCQPPEAHEQR